MPAYTGKDLVIRFGGTALSSQFRNFNTDESAAEIDVTAGNAARKAYIVGPTDSEITGEFLDQTSGTANWGAVKVGNSGTLDWSPEGTAAGKPKSSCLAVVTKRSRAFPYDGAVSYNVSWRPQADVTEGTN